MRNFKKRIIYLFYERKFKKFDFWNMTKLIEYLINSLDLYKSIIMFVLSIFTSIVFWGSFPFWAFLIIVLLVLLIPYIVIDYNDCKRNSRSSENIEDAILLQTLLKEELSVISKEQIEELHSIFDKSATRATNFKKVVLPIAGIIFTAFFNFCFNQLLDFEVITYTSKELADFAVFLFSVICFGIVVICAFLNLLNSLNPIKAQHERIAELLYYVKLNMQEANSFDNSNVGKIECSMGNHKQSNVIDL